MSSLIWIGAALLVGLIALKLTAADPAMNRRERH